MNIRRPLRGFTLIELLVASSIIAIIAATTIPYFHRFSSRQEQNQALGQIRSDLQMVQGRALSSTDREVDEVEYYWWGVGFAKGSSEYQLLQSADEADPENGWVIRRHKNLPLGFSAEDSENMNVTVWFKVLQGDVYIDSLPLSGDTFFDSDGDDVKDHVISICGPDSCYGIVISAGGRIGQQAPTPTP